MQEVSVLLPEFAEPAVGDVGGHVHGGEALSRAVHRNGAAAAETEIACFVEHAALPAPLWQSVLVFLPVVRYFFIRCLPPPRLYVPIVFFFVYWMFVVL